MDQAKATVSCSGVGTVKIIQDSFILNLDWLKMGFLASLTRLAFDRSLVVLPKKKGNLGS